MSIPWWRTTDILRWGAATSGGALSGIKFDENFWALLERIVTLETTVDGVNFVGIDSIDVVGENLVFTMTDYSTQAVTFPIALPNPRGEWTASTFYSFYDWVTNGGALYMVNLDHTSALTFDPNAQITGNNIYTKLVESPSNIIPTGGAEGSFLVKASSADYDTEWLAKTDVFALDDMSDVDLGTFPEIGHVLTWDGTKWISSDVPIRGAPVIPVSATTHDLDITEVGSWLMCTSVSGCTITIPAEADVPFLVGDEVHIDDNTGGAGVVIDDSNVTLRPAIAGGGILFNDGGTVTLKKTGADIWKIIGTTT